MCGWMVVCPTCGNNSCNGGYGEVDGKECPDCPKAYKLMDIGYDFMSLPRRDSWMRVAWMIITFKVDRYYRRLSRKWRMPLRPQPPA
jgi:hypothetical protein